MTFEEHMLGAKTEYDKETVRADDAETMVRNQESAIEDLNSEIAAKNATIISQRNTIETLEARIAELEDGGPTEPPTTPPDPPPAMKPPAINNDPYFAPLDMKRYFLDKTPPERVTFLSKNRVRFRWSPKLATGVGDIPPEKDMRAQMVIRAVYGGGGTPRRDPVPSTRWYAWGFGIEKPWPTHKASEKCLCGQWHQGNAPGVKSPPASIEVINLSTDTDPLPIIRLVMALPSLPDGRVWYKAGNLPAVGVLTRFLAHVKWHPTDGFFKLWRDGDPRIDAPLVHHVGPTCHSMLVANEGINPSQCNYNPGHENGAFANAPDGWERSVLYGYQLIGDEENTVSDMVAAVIKALA